MRINTPDLWQEILPAKTDKSHKYTCGHALIYAAPELTGATRLAASACARIGTGLVSVLSPKECADIYRISLPAHILVRDQLDWFDARVTARLYGPGGLSTQPDFNSQTPVILDADALSPALPDKLSPHYILTPHEGEFERIFPDLEGVPAERAQKAAQKINAHIILKGVETIIASPNGDLVKNNHASPHLATAGTGDVLAGIVTGLIAQNTPVFEACCAGVWMHGECAKQFGAGLVSSDLIDMLPQVLKTYTS